MRHIRKSILRMKQKEQENKNTIHSRYRHRNNNYIARERYNAIARATARHHLKYLLTNKSTRHNH